MLPEDVFCFTSSLPGPTVVIFAGVHGNELAGVYALQRVHPALQIIKGTLYVVYANPPAIAANVRMIIKNLNRCFYKGNIGSTPEDVRAQELMKILDKSDALLDLHMFYDDDGVPFVICEDNALDIASRFDVEILSTNWSKSEPGATDGYMFEIGKIGICVECGPLAKPHEYVDFATKTIFQFLDYFGMTNSGTPTSESTKRIIRAKKSIYKTSKDFKIQAGLKNFDSMTKGQIVAKDKTKLFKAGSKECIIFPHYNARVGEEAYIIGDELRG